VFGPTHLSRRPRQTEPSTNTDPADHADHADHASQLGHDNPVDA
jgi:hypothetical protein